MSPTNPPPLPRAALPAGLLPGILLAALLLLAGAAAAAQEPAPEQSLVLRNLVMDNQGGTILVRFRVDVDVSGPVVAMLQDGEVLGLRCRATLERVRTVWFNKGIVEAGRLIFLKYDQLNNRFVAEDSEAGRLAEHPEASGLLSKALANLSLSLGPWNALDQGQQYRLDLEIKLDRVDVPAWLKRGLFFWDFEVAKPTRYRLEFSP